MKTRLVAMSLAIALISSACTQARATEESPAFSSVPATNTPQGGRDYSTTRTSDAGVYTVSFEPDGSPIAINKIQTWTIHVETADGTLVDDAAIAVGGGMPEHGHGLPTQPEVTENLGGGDYKVEGIKFQMPGWWIVTFDIDSEAGHDSVTFNLQLN